MTCNLGKSHEINISYKVLYRQTKKTSRVSSFNIFNCLNNIEQKLNCQNFVKADPNAEAEQAGKVFY